MRNNDLTFPLIKNEYTQKWALPWVTKKHKNRKQSIQNTKIGNNPRIRGLQQKHETILKLAQNTKIGNNPRIRELQQK